MMLVLGSMTEPAMSMARKLVIICCLVLAANTTSLFSALAQQPKPLRGRLSLPTKDWGVVLDLPGFAVKSVETMPDGRRYMVAENATTNVVVSLTLEDIRPGAHPRSCRQSLEEKAKNKEVKIH